MNKIRPQICLAIVCATLIGGMGMYVGQAMGATEIITAVLGAIFGFLGGVSLKVLENE